MLSAIHVQYKAVYAYLAACHFACNATRLLSCCSSWQCKPCVSACGSGSCCNSCTYIGKKMTRVEREYLGVSVTWAGSFQEFKQAEDGDKAVV